MKWAALLLIMFLPVAPQAQNAADAYYDPKAMQAARDALHKSHGGGTTSMILAERTEYRSNDGDPALVWDGQGWIGGDIHKLWLKTEGEYLTDDDQFEEFELQALYSRAIHAFWDLQAGFRHDIKPDPSRSYAVIGLQGTAPYWFALDGALFLSDEGDLSARFEAEYELRITQRLILQPRLELNAAFSDDAAIGIGSGLSYAQAGLRLRYEITREFAPYVGVVWQRAFGNTADFTPGDPDSKSFVAGFRFWF